MKLIERKFRQGIRLNSEQETTCISFASRNATYWVETRDGGSVCHKELMMRFAIPKSVTTIWISFHSHTAANRWPVRIARDRHPSNLGAYCIDVLPHNGFYGEWITNRRIVALLAEIYKRIGEKILYAEIQYEETDS